MARYRARTVTWKIPKSKKGTVVTIHRVVGRTAKLQPKLKKKTYRKPTLASLKRLKRVTSGWSSAGQSRYRL